MYVSPKAPDLVIPMEYATLPGGYYVLASALESLELHPSSDGNPFRVKVGFASKFVPLPGETVRTGEFTKATYDELPDPGDVGCWYRSRRDLMPLWLTERHLHLTSSLLANQ